MKTRKLLVIGTFAVILALVFTSCGDGNNNNGCTHQWELESVEEEPTCTEEGLGTRVCALCEEVDDNYILPPEHQWGEWEITKEPTVSEEGEKTKICSVCEEEENEILTMLIPTPGLSFTLINNDTAYSVSRGTATDTEVIIPAIYNGLPVTTIAYIGFQSYTAMTSILLPNSVTSINSSAFALCTGLTSITIPNSVTSIGFGTFQGCTGLTSVTIPDSVTSIGDGAFSDCTGLTSIDVDTNNPNFTTYDGILYNKLKTQLIKAPAAGINGNITIPDSVTSIGQGAFSGCTGLTSITIPDSVTSIDGWAFDGCTGLTSIDVDTNNPNFTTYDGILYNKLKTQLIKAPAAGINGNITIPDSVTSIGQSAFSGCTGLTNITIPNSVTSIGSLAFSGCTGLTNITIPNSVTSVGQQAFYRCTSLTSVTMSNVTSIHHNAFFGCTGLTSVTLGTITEADFHTNTFPGNLRDVYFADGGGAGTYTTTNPGWDATWTKQ